MPINQKLWLRAPLVVPILFTFSSTAGGALPTEEKLWNLPTATPVSSAKTIPTPKNVSPAADLKMAISTYEKGNVWEAEILFKSIVLKHKGNALAHYYYANCLAKSGDHANARDQYFTCMKFTQDQVLSNYCIEAIKALNINAELRHKERHLDQEALRLRSQIDADHDRLKGERQKQLDRAIHDIEKRLNEDRLANPGSRTALETKAKYDIAILKLDFQDSFKLIEDDYARRLQAFSSSHESLKGQIRAKDGASQVIPANTSMTVRNYMNFGGSPDQEKIVESTSPGLRATPGVLRASPVSNKKSVRPSR